jgi:hypothetical protein
MQYFIYVISNLQLQYTSYGYNSNYNYWPFLFKDLGIMFILFVACCDVQMVKHESLSMVL